MSTANGKYSYQQNFFDCSLDEWVQLAHADNCKSQGWYVSKLKSGGFGYDNMCLSLAHTIQAIENDPDILEDIDKLSELIHQGWSTNYLYWRDHKPWLKAHTGNYNRPSKPLGDSRRDLCAKQSFGELNEEEQEKDRVIARFLQRELEIETRVVAARSFDVPE